jgi:DNA repair protein RAD5
LFDVIGLKPEIESKAKGPKSFKGRSEASQKQDKKTVKEIVGDGEEVEVEAGQELSTNDIGLIYKR